MRYLIKVENEIKSQISYYFTEKNGENQKEYLDTANYNYVGKKNQRDIDRLIKILEGYVTKPTVPNVVFPCALLVDQDTGRITMYYGCADTVVGMAFTTLDELIKFTKEHS